MIEKNVLVVLEGTKAHGDIGNPKAEDQRGAEDGNQHEFGLGDVRPNVVEHDRAEKHGEDGLAQCVIAPKIVNFGIIQYTQAQNEVLEQTQRDGRGGSVCLNNFRTADKWISAPVMPRPGLVAAR